MKVKEFTVILTTVDPFRIGGKDDPLSDAENPVSTVGGRICIPGPSLKGALRGELERWLNDQYYDRAAKRWKDEYSAMQPCIPATKLFADEQRLVTEGHFRGQGCHYPCSIGDRGKCGKTMGSVHQICPVCYLLGAMGLSGFVSVPFLFSNIRYDSLYSARIDRAKQTVVDGTNRSYQLIPPGTIFSGNLIVLLQDDLRGWELGKPRPLKETSGKDAWLEQPWDQEKLISEMILNRLSAISRMGGYRSKGFGRVTIELK